MEIIYRVFGENYKNLYSSKIFQFVTCLHSSLQIYKTSPHKIAYHINKVYCTYAVLVFLTKTEIIQQVCPTCVLQETLFQFYVSLRYVLCFSRVPFAFLVSVFIGICFYINQDLRQYPRYW